MVRCSYVRSGIAQNIVICVELPCHRVLIWLMDNDAVCLDHPDTQCPCCTAHATPRKSGCRTCKQQARELAAAAVPCHRQFADVQQTVQEAAWRAALLPKPADYCVEVLQLRSMQLRQCQTSALAGVKHGVATANQSCCRGSYK